MRIKFIRVFIIFLFLLILTELFYVQVIRGRYYYSVSTRNRIRVVPLEGWRGHIFDRNGVVLADNSIAYNVMIVPQSVTEAESLFEFVSRTLGVPKKELYARYHQRKFTPFTPVNIAEDISQKEAIMIEENKFLYPSLFVQESFKRVYPFGESGAHILGYVGKGTREDIKRLKEYGHTLRGTIGKSGVELYYDSYLRGSDGGMQIEVNSRGQQVRMLGLKEARPGQDIALTIDSRLQDIAHELFNPQPGALVVMDLDNGEILGMVSSPAFNPNYFVDQTLRKKTQPYLTDSQAPLINRAIKGQFPPGSVFKVPVALCGLDTKSVNVEKTYFCEGFYTLGGRRFGCTHVHGAQNLMEAVSHSCNVYFYHLGLAVGAASMSQYAKMFGLGELTHVDLPFEKEGFIPSANSPNRTEEGKWFQGDILNFSIGQGNVLSTPIQLVQMMATVANSGTVVAPHLIKSIEGKSVDWYNYKRELNISKSAFESVQKGLRATVVSYSGTAHAVHIDDLYVAGKTGTAQSSGSKEDHSWFVGYAVSNKKRVAFCVFLEHGGSSQNACLIARQLLLRMQKERMI